MEMHLFDHDILCKPGEPSSFAGHITNNWSINGIPDGGYLMAIIAKAMMQHSEMKATPIITANFLNRCEPGDAKILIEKMTASRQFNRFQGSLRQNGKE
ncbi:MAG: thioesterase family protein, partial [Desulfobacterales bacterium]